MLPDLNRIRVFYHVFETGSVASAARELNITPSAVSQALAKLEEELTLPLFTRLHRKLVPTAAGEDLFGLSAPLIRNLEEGIDRLVRQKGVPSGMLRIGSPIEFGKSYFPGIFAAFRSLYPEVVFSMKLGDPSEIFPMILCGALDFGLVDIFLTRDQVRDLGPYHIDPLIEEEVILACSRPYYDREIKGDHSFGHLVKREFISYQKSSVSLRNWFKHHFNRFSPELNRVLTVDSHQAVINGILSDIGMGVVARHIVEGEIGAGRIVPIATGRKAVINKIALVQLKDKKPSLTEKTFIRFIQKDIKASDMRRRFLPRS